MAVFSYFRASCEYFNWWEVVMESSDIIFEVLK